MQSGSIREVTKQMKFFFEAKHNTKPEIERTRPHVHVQILKPSNLSRQNFSSTELNNRPIHIYKQVQLLQGESILSEKTTIGRLKPESDSPCELWFFEHARLITFITSTDFSSATKLSKIGRADTNIIL